MQDIKNLLVWKKSISLISAAYKQPAIFPPEEEYNLTSRTPRAVISISTNIAKHLANFLQISPGFACEVERSPACIKKLLSLNQN